MMSTATLYERLGGQPAVRDLAARLHTGILGDPLLGAFFTSVDRTRQVERMAAFITSATGGPDHYAAGACARHTPSWPSPMSISARWPGTWPRHWTTWAPPTPTSPTPPSSRKPSAPTCWARHDPG